MVLISTLPLKRCCGKIQVSASSQFRTFCLSLSGRAYNGTHDDEVLSIAVSFPPEPLSVSTEGISF